jgi:hypothetical protein
MGREYGVCCIYILDRTSLSICATIGESCSVVDICVPCDHIQSTETAQV